MDIRDLIIDADKQQNQHLGDLDSDLVVVIEGGHAFRGHVSLHGDTIILAPRLDLAMGGRMATTTVRLSAERDGGTSETHVHIPLSRVLFAHYATLEN